MRARRLALGLALALAGPVGAAGPTPSFEVVAKIAVDGPGRWDYMHVDPERHRLYLAHGTQTEVFDTQSNRLVGTLADTPGVRAIATAPDLGLGYTSNGAADTVTVFDLQTLATKGTIAVGQGPDAIVYDRAHQRVLVFNARSQDVSVIDAQAGRVLRTEPIGGEPEMAVQGGGGLVYFNIEDTHELVAFDPDAMVVRARHSLLPCRRPTALAVDREDRLYAACRSGVLMVRAADGQALGSAPIGRGSDGVAWLDGLAYSANGTDGTLSIVGRGPKGGWTTLAVLPTAYGSRTLAADPVARRLYLPVASFQTAAGQARPLPVPGTLVLWVLAPR